VLSQDALDRFPAVDPIAACGATAPAVSPGLSSNRVGGGSRRKTCIRRRYRNPREPHRMCEPIHLLDASARGIDWVASHLGYLL
jgi:hypothetical protein